MNEQINFGQYLSDEEQKSIAKEVFRAHVSKMIEKEANLTRFLSNVAYETVSQLCDDTLDISMKDLIQENVVRVVQGLTDYTVFRKPSAYDRECNGMYTFLAQCLEEQKPVVKKIVEEVVPVATLQEVESNIQECIIQAVQDIYKTGNNNE